MVIVVQLPPPFGPPRQAAAFFATFTLARLRASTGHFLQRDLERQHFFLTLPAFVHFRT